MITNVFKSLIVSNFGPFADAVKFTTTTDTSKKELLDTNTFNVNDQICNKVSYIYGSNGAGKSNFCKAVLQIQKLLALAPILASNNPQLIEISPIKSTGAAAQNSFKFDRKYNDKPTSFCIEMIIDCVTYTYSFSVLEDKIITEKLTKKNRRTETILDRSSSNYIDIQLKSEMTPFKNNIAVVKENVLCLSMAAFLNIKIADKLVSFINEIKVVNMAALRSVANITEDACTKERISKYLNVLKFADPNLKDIQVSFNEKKIERQRMNVPDLEDRELVVRSVQIGIASTHRVFDGYHEIDQIELPFLQIESNGTIKLFGILPIIFDALESGGVVIIDEIENGLHPSVVKQIIALFIDPHTNPNNSQLICTTHNVSLIEKCVRRDQIWILTKNDRGISTIKRVSDIPGMRAYDNNGQRYLKAAFGEVPSSIFN